MNVAGFIAILAVVLIIWNSKNAEENNKTFIEEFPHDDGNGNEALVLQQFVPISGITKPNGNDPQPFLKKKKAHEEVFFKRIAYDGGKFPYATQVIDSNGNYLGWLQEGSKIQEEVAKRLDNKEKVLARVNRTYSFQPRDQHNMIYGIELDIQKYSKVRTKQ